MVVVRILVNALIMASELIAVAAVAWLGLHFPLHFAIGTAVLAFALGLALEHARLKHELPFYFGGSSPRAGLLVPFVALTSALVRAAVAGLVALLTFSGTDAQRLVWVAIVFGATLYLATSLLRLLTVRLEARPARWGYFRLGAPLGVMFSLGLAFAQAIGRVPTPGLTDLGRTILFDTPARPSLEQASELLFQLKLYIDSVIVTLLKTVMSVEWAQTLGLLLSVNVLTGFVVALYAVLIAEAVVKAEDVLL
jgi:hypothetical protein